MAQGFRDYVLSLAAGVEQSITVRGDYWQILSATSAVKLRFDTDGTTIVRYQGMGGPAKYDRIAVTSDTAQNVVIGAGLVGDKPPYDNRFTFGGTLSVAANGVIPNVNDTTPDAVVPATTGQILIAADATRRGAWVGLASTEAGPVRIMGASPAAANGIVLEPGDKIFFEGTAALTVYNPNAAAVTVTTFPQQYV